MVVVVGGGGCPRLHDSRAHLCLCVSNEFVSNIFLINFVTNDFSILQMKLSNKTATNDTTDCGGLNPSFHHCFSSEIHSFQEALTSILVVEFLIVIVGVVGNLCLFLLMKRKRFASQAFGVYFMFSAVSDSMNLIINLASDIAGTIAQDDFSAQAARAGNCGWMLMLTSVPGKMSPWLIVLLTFDRFVASYFPHKYSKFVTRRRGFVCAFGLFLLTILVNIPFAISYKTHVEIDDDTNETSMNCEMMLFDNHRMGELIELIIGNIIPLCLIVVLSVAIFTALKKRNRFKGPISCQWNRSSILIFYVAVMIFLAWFPGSVVSFIETANEVRGIDSPIATFVTDKAWHACLLLYLFSFAQNFYILMLISPMYRAEFKKLLCCQKEDDRVEQYEMDSDNDETPMLKELGTIDNRNNVPCNSVTI